MKADVQYNDYIGTAAADISDHTDLKAFLQSRKVDTKRFDPIGASFYHGYNDFFSMSIICTDRDKSTTVNPYIVKIHFESAITHEEFFNLFKRFNVIVTIKHGGYQDNIINEELVFDDRAEE